MKLGSLGKHKELLGLAAVAGLGLYLYSRHKSKKAMPPPMPMNPHDSHAMLGYSGSPKNPGFSDLDNQVHWVAAGNAAGLDPGPFSYLTKKNENPLLSHVPFVQPTGEGARNFEAMKVQGSYGFTPVMGFTTYF